MWTELIRGMYRFVLIREVQLYLPMHVIMQYLTDQHCYNERLHLVEANLL